MSDFPTPKYRVGDQFWRVVINTTREQLPCPDCLDTKSWKVTTPAGVELSCACPRCGGGYSSLYPSLAKELPSLTYIRYVGVAELFTVRGIEANSHGPPDGEYSRRVRYYSSPRGGTVIYEEDAYPSAEAAKAVADAQAAIANAKLAADPQRIEQARFGSLIFRDAATTLAQESTWNAWYGFRRLVEDIGDLIKDTPEIGGAAGDLMDSLNDALDWATKHRARPTCPEPRAWAGD